MMNSEPWKSLLKGPVGLPRFTRVFLLGLLLSAGCQRNVPITIAVIPRTSGTMLWEPEHRGAQQTALDLGARIYWNAPTREDDVEGQIALVQRVSSGGYQGLILAPDQSRALITPIRRAMQRGLSIVVIGSPLPIPPADRLSYILNDDEAGGQIAAQRVATMLHGQGSVAILGINENIAGIVDRARSIENFLTNSYPRIRVVKHFGSFNFSHEQQVSEEIIKANPDLDAVIALTATSMVGTMSALDDIRPDRRIQIVGFDPESLNFDNPHLDSLIIEDTRKMGDEAVRWIVGRTHGPIQPVVTRYQPILVTRENANSAEVRQLTNMDWRPEPLARAWRAIQ
jgi:ribose transport system substrate-binding protein